MPEKLTPAIERKWNPRLENWALWYVDPDKPSPSPSQVAESPAYERLANQDTSAPREGARTYENASAEPFAGLSEALATDDLVCLLPKEWHDAIKAWYCWTGTLEMRAKALGCHADTLRNRRNAALEELERLDTPRTKPGRPSTAAAIVVRRTRYVPDDIVD